MDSFFTYNPNISSYYHYLLEHFLRYKQFIDNNGKKKSHLIFIEKGAEF